MLFYGFVKIFITFIFPFLPLPLKHILLHRIRLIIAAEKKVTADKQPIILKVYLKVIICCHEGRMQQEWGSTKKAKEWECSWQESNSRLKGKNGSSKTHSFLGCFKTHCKRGKQWYGQECLLLCKIIINLHWTKPLLPSVGSFSSPPLPSSHGGWTLTDRPSIGRIRW